MMSSSSKDKSGNGGQPPKVYWWFWHPHKTFLDIILCLIISLIMPLIGLPSPLSPPRSSSSSSSSTLMAAATSSTGEGEEPKTTQAEEKEQNNNDNFHAHVEHAQKLRQPLDKVVVGEGTSKNGCYRKLAKAVGCDIVEVTLNIPREDDDDPKKKPDEEGAPTVPVHVAFPITLMPSFDEQQEEELTKNEYGCVTLEDDKILDKLPKDIPVIIFFHGGGFTIGNARMSEGMNLLLKMLELEDDPKEEKKEDETTKPKAKSFIFASVDYSLAPEHPYPIPPLEAISVTNHFLTTAGFENVHILGVSAGGAHALVAGLELYRRSMAAETTESKADKAKALKSVVAFCPMLNPACDSLSYYQNSKSSHMVPISWLRWCYRVYLQLPEEDSNDTTTTEDGDDSLDNLLSRGSNRKAWQSSKWFTASETTKDTPPYRRWAEPAYDLPKFNDSKDDGPLFIITTNDGDPLKDDGVAMVNGLQQAGADISYHSHPGSHYLGSVIHQKGYNKVAKEWSTIVFPPTNNNNNNNN